MDLATLSISTIITSLGILYTFHTLHSINAGKISAGLLFPYISREKNAMHFWFLALINGFIALTVLIFGICLSMFSLSF
ncbi:MAG TPA: hypothetical protein ENI42_06305 [Thermoplasmatales archaeon]|nr:hypothetical protein [Thermoplasmatales archaeon]